MLLNPLKGNILKKYPDGNIYQTFGESKALYLAAVGKNGHCGLDIATFEGDPVRAAHDGTVVEVFDQPNGYGKHIRLISQKLPDGTYIETIYGHMRNLTVGVGQQIHVGHILGEESNTGFVISGGSPYWNNAPAGKGVHLHFGVRILIDVQPNTHQIYFTHVDKSFTILGYDNGIKGYIDPFTIGFTDDIIDTMLDLYKEKDRLAVYAKINGNFYYIGAEAMADLVAGGLARWEDVKETDQKIDFVRVIK